MRAFATISMTVVAILGCSGVGSQTVVPSDRDVVYTASMVSQTHEGIEIDPSLETWDVSRSFDGTWDIDYEYDAAESETPLVIISSAIFDTSPSNAKISYTGLNLGLKLSFGDNVRDANELLTLGDQHECGIILTDAKEASGNYCIIQDGSVSYMWLISGFVFTEPGDLDPVFGPLLTNAKSYRPGDVVRPKK